MFLKSILLQFKFVEVVTGFFFFFLVQILMLSTFLLTNKQQNCHWCPIQFVSPWKMFSNFFPTYHHSRTLLNWAKSWLNQNLPLHFKSMFSSLVLSVQDHRWLQLYFRIVWPPLASTLIPKEHLECGGWEWRGRPKKHYACLGRKSKSKRKSLLFQIKNGISSEVRNWWRCTQLMSALSELLALGRQCPSPAVFTQFSCILPWCHSFLICDLTITVLFLLWSCSEHCNGVGKCALKPLQMSEAIWSENYFNQENKCIP